MTVLLNRRNNNNSKSCFSHQHHQDIVLDQFNYSDGISVFKNGRDIGYSKVIKALKVRCDVIDNKIGWTPESDWYYAVLNLEHSNFYFLLQRMFDPY